MAEPEEPIAADPPRLRVYRPTSPPRAWHVDSRHSRLPFSERKLLPEVMTSLRRGDKAAILLPDWKAEVGATFIITQSGPA